MAESFYKQIESIRQEVRNIANDFTLELAKQAEKDLVEAHNKIIKGFYGAYDPKYYNRDSQGLRKTLIRHRCDSRSYGHSASIQIGSNEISNHYNISPDNVFDLMWNKAVRGLPYSSKSGEWKNPAWGHFPNTYTPDIEIGAQQLVEGTTPHNVMCDLVNSWAEASGWNTCDKIAQKYK